MYNTARQQGEKVDSTRPALWIRGMERGRAERRIREIKEWRTKAEGGRGEQREDQDRNKKLWGKGNS